MPNVNCTLSKKLGVLCASVVDYNLVFLETQLPIQFCFLTAEARRVNNFLM
jgi:hypothetical protein